MNTLSRRVARMAVAATAVVGLVAVTVPAEAATKIPVPTMTLAKTYDDAGASLTFKATLPVKATSIKVQQFDRGAWKTTALGKVTRTTKKTTSKRYVTGTVKTRFGKTKFQVIGKVGKASYASKSVTVTGYKWLYVAAVSSDSYLRAETNTYGRWKLGRMGHESAYGYDAKSDLGFVETADGVSCRKVRVGLSFEGSTGKGTGTLRLATDRKVFSTLSFTGTKKTRAKDWELSLDGTALRIDWTVKGLLSDSSDETEFYAGARLWCSSVRS